VLSQFLPGESRHGYSCHFGIANSSEYVAIALFGRNIPGGGLDENNRIQLFCQWNCTHYNRRIHPDEYEIAFVLKNQFPELPESSGGISGAVLHDIFYRTPRYSSSFVNPLDRRFCG